MADERLTSRKESRRKRDKLKRKSKVCCTDIEGSDAKINIPELVLSVFLHFFVMLYEKFMVSTLSRVKIYFVPRCTFTSFMEGE